VEVRNEADNSLASLFSDRAGIVPLSNPFDVDAEGFAQFFVIGGAYKITAIQGSFTRPWRYVAIGRSAEFDTVTQWSVDTFSGTGSEEDYTLSQDPGSQNNTLVSISGVTQHQSAYSISGLTLTINAPVGTDNIEVKYGSAVEIGVPPDASVSTAKLGTGAVTAVKISDSDLLAIKTKLGIGLIHHETLDLSSGSSAVSSGLPSGIKALHLVLSNVSQSSTGHVLARIGPLAGIEDSGYLSVSSSLANGVNPANTTATDSFIMRVGNAGSILSGTVNVRRASPSGHRWNAGHTLTASGIPVVGAGTKTLADELERVEILPSAGTFDGAGTADVYYEL
jgi:hypothetical protein